MSAVHKLVKAVAAAPTNQTLIQQLLSLLLGNQFVAWNNDMTAVPKDGTFVDFWIPKAGRRSGFQWDATRTMFIRPTTVGIEEMHLTPTNWAYSLGTPE